MSVAATLVATTGTAITNSVASVPANPLLYAWGNNGFGQIGDGTTHGRLMAVSVALPGGVAPVSVVSGGDMSLALGPGGALYAWGDNQHGQLGNGTTTSSSTPILIKLPHHEQAVAVAVDYTVLGGNAVLNHADTSMALGADGHLYVWGDNESGQFGNNTMTGSSVPVEVTLPGGLAAVAIAGARETTYALASNGTMFAWGLNDLGSIGDGTTTKELVPTRVHLPTGVRAMSITAGYGTAMARVAGGQVYGWGNNSHGQLADDPSNAVIEVPQLIPTPTGVHFTSVTTGGDTSAAIGSNGGVYTWGYNEHGEVGNGTTTDTDVPARVILPGNASVSAVVVGYLGAYDGGCQLCGSGIVHSGTVFATTTGGKIFAWGVNDDGEFGNGTTTGSRVPVAVPKPGGHTPSLISTNGGTALAIAGGSTGLPPVFDVDDPPLAVSRGTQYNAVFAAGSATSYGLADAPAWLAVDAHGAVTGIPPTNTTSFSYRVSASNAAGTTTTAAFQVAVQKTAPVRGIVVTPGSSPQPVVGAAVEACTTSQVCDRTNTDGAGAFVLAVPIASTFRVTAHPPGSSSDLVTTSTNALHQPSAGTTDINIALGGLSPLEDGLRLDGSANPVLYWGSPTSATQSGCKNGIGFVTIDGQNANTDNYDVLIYPLVETPEGSGNYAGTIPPLAPVHGAVDVRSSITCPEASALTPNSGPSAGGTQVVITGTGFTHATAVSFGSTPATSFSVSSDAAIVATSPAGNGTVPVNVTVGGSSTVIDRYTYAAVTAILPTHGPAGGGNAVTITGTGVSDARGVFFGATPAAFTQISPTSIRAIAPPGRGTQAVVVVSPLGFVTSDTHEAEYTYDASSRPNRELNTTRITGSLRSGSSIVIRSALESMLTLMVKNPKVVDAGVTAGEAGANSIIDQLQPTCHSQDKLFGQLAPLFVSGAFEGIVKRVAYGAAVYAVEVGALAALPAAALALVAFVAANYFLDDAITEYATAAIDAVRRRLGQAGCKDPDVKVDPSGTVVNTNGAPINGAATTILRSDSAAGPFRAVPSGSADIEPSTNPETTAADGGFHWDVISGFYEIRASAPHCTDPDDPSSTSATIGPYAVPPPRVGLVLTLACAHEAPPAAPTITQLSTTTGPTAGGTNVDITGSGFTPSSTVSFGATAARSVTYLSPQALRVVSPAGTGTQDVTAANAGHRSAQTSADKFVFSDPPTVVGVTPSSGPAGGGTPVTVIGTGFTGATAVLFGASPATSFTVESDTTITAVTPSGSTGPVDVAVVTANGPSLPTEADTFTYTAGSAAGAFRALSPSRVLDTRSGIGAAKAPLASKQVLTLTVAGRGGVPSSGVSAVVLNVTVTRPSAGGYITVYPDGVARPVASNLNHTSDETIPNLVVVPVGTDGKVDLYNGSAGTVQLFADVAGYYLAGTPTAAGTFAALSPSRVLDTRSGIGAAKAPLASKQVLTLTVAGRGGVPSSGVSAVVLNVTVTRPSAGGYITVYPDGVARPVASNLNHTSDETIPNLVVVPVGTDGKVDLYNGSAGTVQLFADVAGYYLAGTPTAAGTFAALSPSRVLDTRSGIGAAKAPLASKQVLTLTVAGRGGVPSSGVSAVVLNVTVTRPSAGGYITVYPDGVARPVASNLNHTSDETIPNLVVVPVGTDGKVDLYNGSAGTVQLFADVAGYYLAGAPSDR